jgi:hypothetical protein
MNRSLRRVAMILMSSGALVIAGTGPAVADSRGGGCETVRVVGNGTSAHVSDRTLDAGCVRFKVSSTNAATQQGGGSSITLFRLRPHHTLNQFVAHLHDEFSANAKVAARGTRELKADAVFRGLADVVPGYPETVTEKVAAGTYYVMDLGSEPMNGRPQFTRLTVRDRHDGHHEGTGPRSDLTVTIVHDRFHAPKRWPHEGTYTFRNQDDTIHFMVMIPVKKGTTDADVKKALTKPTEPDFLVKGPGGGNDVVSPGRTLKVTYDLPRGTYVLLCFVADEETGMPHAVMGMHKVVVLK